MKTFNYLYLIILGGLLFLPACQFDNYDEPQLVLSGTIMNGDEPLNTRYGVILKLFQYREDGFIDAGAGSIDLYVNQEGKYNALLFPGRYKMTVNRTGPLYTIHTWNDFPKNEENLPDTIYLDLNSNKTMNFSVTPFYQIRDFQAFYRNDSIISRFVVKKVTERDDNQVLFRQVALFLSPTVHVNNDTPLLERKSGVKVDEVTEIKTSLKGYYTDDASKYLSNYRNYVYVRAGISLRLEAQETIYSPVIKIEGIPQETISKFK